MFGDIYKNKRVFITGHTGFKGSWLSAWLLKLGATVSGYSDTIPTNPAIFDVLDLRSKLNHHFGDIRDLEGLRKSILDFKPDFVFHLAAQPIVSISYDDPIGTLTTNIIGTANVLEVIRQIKHKCNLVLVTSDKCYENFEWVWGYRETDHLGGKDIYSGSKGACEIAIHAYFHSFFKDSSNIRLATGRAGNVIGGGDWAQDRVVADCVRGWSAGQPVEIRSPLATRPWQHVLEPLSGYLLLGANLSRDDSLNGNSFNFGPRSEQNHTVLQLLNDLSKYWDNSSPKLPYKITDNIPFHEAGLLKLNCDKALFHLKWEANLTYDQCVKLVGDWYFAFYDQKQDMYKLTLNQIEEYEVLATERKLIWT
jgi:CDP-glucose 4,6-dehydratase